MLQPVVPHESRCVVQTILVYKTGEIFEAGTISLPVEKSTPQGFCTAVTYARRYGASSALYLSTHDDDGNEASGIKSNQPVPVQKASTPLDFYLYYIDEDKMTLAIQHYLDEHKAVYKEHGLYKSNVELPKLVKYKITQQQWAVKLKEIAQSKFSSPLLVVESVEDEK
jgi:hypothetical protein